MTSTKHREKREILISGYEQIGKSSPPVLWGSAADTFNHSIYYELDTLRKVIDPAGEASIKEDYSAMKWEARIRPWRTNCSNEFIEELCN